MIFVVLRLATSSVFSSFSMVSSWWSRQWDFSPGTQRTRRHYKVLYAKRWIRKKRQETENFHTTVARDKACRMIGSRSFFSLGGWRATDEYWNESPRNFHSSWLDKKTVAACLAFLFRFALEACTSLAQFMILRRTFMMFLFPYFDTRTVLYCDCSLPVIVNWLNTSNCINPWKSRNFSILYLRKLMTL